jgi:radical SAM-linked protein
MRYTGHLDLHRSWERTFRRSGLPLAYSLGFHPQPRLNLACALPLGFTSQCEMLDAWLENDLPCDQASACLNHALPPGLEIQSIEIIDPQAPALQTQVVSAVYQITFLDEVPDLEEHIQRILAAPQIERKRREKTYDLRPLIENIQLEQPSEDGNRIIQVRLAAREAATGRPEELLDEMGIKFENTRVHREQLIFKS